jgi:hypothetical protein
MIAEWGKTKKTFPGREKSFYKFENDRLVLGEPRLNVIVVYDFFLECISP